jgi:SOS response regulatory protein OraA/RecX
MSIPSIPSAFSLNALLSGPDDNKPTKKELREKLDELKFETEGTDDISHGTSFIGDLAMKMTRDGLYKDTFSTMRAMGLDADLDALIDKAAKMSRLGLGMDKVKAAFKEALDAAQKAVDPSCAVSRVVVEMAQAGLLKDALVVAWTIKDLSYRSDAISVIAEEMAKAGQYKDAIDVACKVDNAEDRSNAFSRIALEMAKVGMDRVAVMAVFIRAIDASWTICSPSHRSYAQRSIVVDMAQAGLFKDALNVARKMDDAFNRAAAFSRIALEMAKNRIGKALVMAVFREALGTVGEIGDRSRRSSGFVNVAEAMAQAGVDMGTVDSVLRQAQNVLRKMGDSGFKSHLLDRIAKDKAQ